MVQARWITVQRFPALLSASRPRRVLRHRLPPAGASPSSQGQIAGATCTPCQKPFGLTWQNCLLKAYFHDFQPGPLPDPNGTLIFRFKCTSSQKKKIKVKPYINAVGIRHPKKIPWAESPFKVLMNFLKALVENPVFLTPFLTLAALQKAREAASASRFLPRERFPALWTSPGFCSPPVRVGGAGDGACLAQRTDSAYGSRQPELRGGEWSVKACCPWHLGESCRLGLFLSLPWWIGSSAWYKAFL